MTVKFIHAADIHLDSPLKGLERYEGAPVQYIRGAARRAFINLVDLGIQEEVDFVLIAGDLYDGDWKDYNTGLFFASQMSRLRDAGIRVFMVRGNHDAASQITKSLRLPDNVRNLSTERPETVVLDDLGIAIHGQGFARRAVTDDLSADYPDPMPGYFNIGLLHTCVDGREGHEPYAPCRLNYLVSKGYDYWALGHVHRREELHKKTPWVVFPGNIQGRHANEAGPKGCSLVTIEDGGAAVVEHCSLDVLRWCVCRLDASDLASPDEILDQAKAVTEEELDRAEGRLVALRFVITGASAAHQKLRSEPERWVNNLRSVVTDAGCGEAWVEKVLIRTGRRADLQELAEDHPVGFLLKFMEEIQKDSTLIQELSAELDDLKAVLPAEFAGQTPELNWKDADSLKEILRDAEELVITRLLSREALE